MSLQKWTNNKTNKSYKQLIYIHISCKCDTNRAGHFTLDAHASRPVACLFEWAHFIQACRWYQGQVQCTYSFCQSVWTSVTRLFTNDFYHQKCRDIFWNSLSNLTGILHRKLLSHDAFDMQNHDNLQAKHQFTCHHLYVTDLRAVEMCHSWSDFIRSFECQRYWRSIVSETGIKGKDK